MITTESQDLVLLWLIPFSIKSHITDLNKKNYSTLNNNQLGSYLAGFIENSLPLKVRRLTKLERSQFSLSADLKATLVGLLLGDLCAVKLKKGTNVRLHFEQGLVHKDYLYHLYELFESYCSTAPKISNRLPDKRTGLIYTRVKFQTRSLPCFNELYDKFYPEGKKQIPENIGELLTPLGLAYWLADDGTFSKSHNVITLSTDSYSESEVDLLISVLTDKFELDCRKVKNGNGWRIVIKRSSLEKFRELVSPHVHSSMSHKLGL